jgi:hypothetical protein
MKMRKIKMDVEKRRRHGIAPTKRLDGSRQPAERIFIGGNQFLVCTVFLSIILTFACTPRSFEKPNTAATPPPSTAEDRQASFQNELEKMKTANLQYVFVFRRTDGGAFDGEDKSFCAEICLLITASF